MFMSIFEVCYATCEGNFAPLLHLLKPVPGWNAQEISYMDKQIKL